MKFAIIAPALISGAFVDRVRFTTFIVFCFLWTTFVYDPVAHWVWGEGGWLRNIGALDFAGGTVVHITAGVAALAISICLRRRARALVGRFKPVSVTLFGAVLLWFGWFGFNGGMSIKISERLKVQDALDVGACHGMAGTWGAIATGIFASKAINPAGADGLIHGNWDLFKAQCWSVVVAWVWTFVATYILVKLVDKVLHFTVTESEQQAGLDKFHYGKISVVYKVGPSKDIE